MIKVILIIFTLLAVSFAATKPNLAPTVLQLNDNIAVVVSCNYKNAQNQCNQLTAKLKYAFYYLAIGNTIALNNEIANNETITNYAIAKKNDTAFVITVIGASGTQYLAVVGLDCSPNDITTTLDTYNTINATGILSIDIEYNNKGICMIAEFPTSNLVGVATDSGFTAYKYEDTKTGTYKSITSSPSGIALFTRTTEGSSCVTTDTRFTYFLIGSPKTSTSGSFESTCSQGSTVSTVIDNYVNILFVYVFNNSAKADTLSFSPTKRKHSEERSFSSRSEPNDWQSPIDVSSFVSTVGLVSSDSVTIDVPEGSTIDAVQATVNDDKSQFVLSYEYTYDEDNTTVTLRSNSKKTVPKNCAIDGAVFNLNLGVKQITRATDSNGTDLSLPLVQCADLGFDRVYYDSDFYLFRYESIVVSLTVPKPSL